MLSLPVNREQTRLQGLRQRVTWELEVLMAPEKSKGTPAHFLMTADPIPQRATLHPHLGLGFSFLRLW